MVSRRVNGGEGGELEKLFTLHTEKLPEGYTLPPSVPIQGRVQREDVCSREAFIYTLVFPRGDFPWIRAQTLSSSGSPRLTGGGCEKVSLQVDFHTVVKDAEEEARRLQRNLAPVDEQLLDLSREQHEHNLLYESVHGHKSPVTRACRGFPLECGSSAVWSSKALWRRRLAVIIQLTGSEPSRTVTPLLAPGSEPIRGLEEGPGVSHAPSPRRRETFLFIRGL
ncbi:unnamed protein product [Pleuronectes platessa]|uniref:Uncharacterized protein n=1 Tax=Pleuronectes platessa TaxID=8262 RepID=A0A9N7TRD3_PLEPL|nr:unnamed protein product [Pleuronectes platessa]